MKRYKVDYDEKRNCFALIRDVSSELVWGDPSYIPTPFLTYVVPTFKRANLLKEALQSILGQLPVDFEWDIIVVDNEAGAQNETELVIKEINNPRILYYRNARNIGVDGNYNRCIELARGKWIAMLHADDLLVNDHLRLMGEYIKAHEHDRKPLAYISPGYMEFSSKKGLTLKRPDPSCKEKDGVIRGLLYEGNRGKLMRFRQIDGAITGYSLGLPSFGTVMNRDVMLENGGFDEQLGICEDVITPYRLAKKYKVYKTPKAMGFYRVGSEGPNKNETILKIYESMVDFREYMFSRNLFTRLWGYIARNELNRRLADYCAQMSRFNEKRLKRKDLADIFPFQKENFIFLGLMYLIEFFYVKYWGIDTFYESCIKIFESLEDEIQERKCECNEFILYGAGRVGKIALKYLRKTFPDINILYIAVSEASGNRKTIEGVPVKPLSNLLDYKETATIITATIIQEYHDEMEETLQKYQFSNVIFLLGEKSEIEEQERRMENEILQEVL